MILKKQLLNWISTLQQEITKLWFVTTISFALVVSIWIFSYLSRDSANILISSGLLARWFPVVVISLAIFWRIAEIIIRLRAGVTEYKLFISRVDNYIHSENSFLILLFLSVFIFHCAILGSLVGINTIDGLLEYVSGIGGVLPFADAKQYYAASMSLPLSGELSTYASRRPVHAINLSMINILTGYDRINIFLFQATLVGASLAIIVTAIARWLGPSLAMGIWGFVVLLSLDTIPSYMSEPTGLWLGLIATFILVSSVDKKSFVLIPLSICIFMLAFSARAGAYFIIIALILIGLYLNKGSIKKLTSYSSALTILLILALSYPFISYSIFETRGASFQGNLSYLLYEFAVDGEDFRQIQRDYPEEFNSTEQSKKSKFIYEKAWNAFLDSPWVFPIAYSKRLVDELYYFPVRHVEYVLANFIDKETISVFLTQNVNTITFVFFYGGFIVLLLTNSLSRKQKLGLILIYVGYALSIPFVQVTSSIRFHAVTWIFSVFLFCSYLMRKTAYSNSPVAYIRIPTVYGYVAILYLFFSIFIVKFSSIYNQLDELAYPEQMIDRNTGYTHYLYLGPNTPYLKLVESNQRTIRPNIDINTFYSNPRMQRNDQRQLIGQAKVGDLVMIGYEPRTGRHTILTTNKISCLPDKNMIYLATSKWIQAPFSRRIISIDRYEEPNDINIQRNISEC